MKPFARASLCLLVPFACVAACSSSSSGPTSNEPSDGSASSSGGSEGGSSSSMIGSCTPAPGFAGNSKFVGAYCTQNGGQCAQYGVVTVQCSIDLDPSGSNFCILIGCSADSDCGEDACCTGRAGNPVHACVPNGCFDGGACPGIPQ
jgi:hypothetical protein